MSQLKRQKKNTWKDEVSVTGKSLTSKKDFRNMFLHKILNVISIFFFFLFRERQEFDLMIERQMKQKITAS